MMQTPSTNRGTGTSQSINFSDNLKLAERALLTPDEVGAFLGKVRSHTLILSKQSGGYPLMAHRQVWHQIPQIAALKRVGLPAPQMEKISA
jgi:hypothetical protein